MVDSRDLDLESKTWTRVKDLDLDSDLTTSLVHSDCLFFVHL